MSSVMVSAVLAISSFGFANTSSINVNTATQFELVSIKGIGPSKARTIIASLLMAVTFRMPMILKARTWHWYAIGLKMVDNRLTIEAPSSFRESNGRFQKEGGASGRRHLRNQAGHRNQSERAIPARIN